MRPITLTHSGTGTGATNSAPVRVDWRADNTTVELNTDGSTTAFTVQYTGTPPDGYASASAWGSAAVWTASGISGATADELASITTPIHGVRIAADASGTDTATVYITQSTT